MIQNLKDLQALLKLLRKQGVTEMTFGDLSLKLGDLPRDDDRASTSDNDSSDPLSGFPTGDLTPEQLIYYSAGGLPENDPYLKDN